MKNKLNIKWSLKNKSKIATEPTDIRREKDEGKKIQLNGR